MMIGYLQLVQRQQLGLVSGINLKHFGLEKCLQLDQAFVDFKKKLVNTLHADRGASTLVLQTLDQVTNANVQIEESLVDTMQALCWTLKRGIPIG